MQWQWQQVLCNTMTTATQSIQPKIWKMDIPPAISAYLMYVWKKRQPPTVVDYDEWSLSNALWMKFYNGHGTYKPKLNDCFQIYWRQLNIAVFVLAVHVIFLGNILTIHNCLQICLYHFHMYFHIQMIL